MESFEEMQSRHRKEQKDLQSRITQKKKGVTKKTRKGVYSECEDLEQKLKEKQALEIAALMGDSVPDIDDVPELEEPAPYDREANGINGVIGAVEETMNSEPALSEDGQPKKRNRQKERLARRKAEQEAAVEAAKIEAANQPDPKAIEHARLQGEFKTRKLVEKLIRPDGHCLFSAVADQLQHAGIPLSADSDADLKEGERYKVVRKAAARYMEGHPDDFVAWLDEPLSTYVAKIRDTAEWGGHLELLALARTYNVEICVLQEGGLQTIEPVSEGKGEPEKIWLAYYRHGFGLGEHYNSLRKVP
jgi:OTU domain-containing protein 6